MIEVAEITMAIPVGLILGLGSLALQLLGNQQGQGRLEEEDAREDQYNSNMGQHEQDYQNLVLEPIGPAPGIPTLNDPSAFQGFDPMNPMAPNEAQVDMDAYNQHLRELVGAEMPDPMNAPDSEYTQGFWDEGTEPQGGGGEMDWLAALLGGLDGVPGMMASGNPMGAMGGLPGVLLQLFGQMQGQGQQQPPQGGR